ncbi:hypothetical protein V9T40_011014 [Parthenolecanium corni]|uniref:Distal membrane-arm assembly complex protein 1-like domain-containing protein n=1 Tax=Parthenolecanium corni TaxID=536013 RepID=A0AAN9XZ28_9HEMI
MSVLSERPKDCLGCKLISGFGLIGIGVYTMRNARRVSGYHQAVMVALALSFNALGTARLLDYEVFPVKANKTDEK